MSLSHPDLWGLVNVTHIHVWMHSPKPTHCTLMKLLISFDEGNLLINLNQPSPIGVYDWGYRNLGWFEVNKPQSWLVNGMFFYRLYNVKLNKLALKIRWSSSCHGHVHGEYLAVAFHQASPSWLGTAWNLAHQKFCAAAPRPLLWGTNPAKTWIKSGGTPRATGGNKEIVKRKKCVLN